jgi:hypothetical protein
MSPRFTSDSSTVVYVYGVTRGDAGYTALSVEGIIPDAPVELLPAGNLAVVASRASKEAFGPPDEETNSDVDWATKRALAHHRVLADLAASYTVAPVKFGALCKGMDDVMALFTQFGDRFEAALNRVEGAQEWGVKMFASQEACLSVAQNASKVTTLKAETETAQPGRAFFLRRKLQAAIDEGMREGLAQRAAQVYAEIARETKETVPAPTLQHLGANLKGNGAVLALDIACLVERKREDAFCQSVANLSGILAPEGFTLKLTGPWPPYSFVAIDTTCSATQPAGEHSYGRN